MADRLSYSLEELAGMLHGELAGPPGLRVAGVSDLARAEADQISFIADAKYLPDLAKTRAGAIVTSPRIRVEKPAIVVPRPDLAFASLLEIFAPPLPHPPAGIHPTAVVESPLDPTVAVGANCYIGPRVHIGANTVIHPNVHVGLETRIGKDCVLWPGVVVRERVSLGDRVIIHPNAVIGADGFGYNLIDGRHVKIHHIGTVVLEDDVEIGANTCVDRAKAGVTTVCRGAKIDNLVQIAHNVTIGPHSVLAAMVGIAGSSVLGRYNVLAGQVGVRDHVILGDEVTVTACACVTKNVPSRHVFAGLPAQDNHEYLRQQAVIRRLPELAATVTELTKRIHELEQTIHDLQRNGT